MELLGLVFLLEAVGVSLVDISNNFVLIGTGLVLVGFGLGLGMLTGFAWVGRITPASRLGKYMGGVTVSIFVGLFATTFTTLGIILALIGAGNYQGMLLLSVGVAAACVVIWYLAGHLQKSFCLTN